MPAKSKPQRTALSPPVALIYAMVTVSAVDRRMIEQEIQRIGSIVRELPPFQGYDDDWMLTAAQDCGRLLSGPEGVAGVLDLVRDALPVELYETAYVLSAEVAASDLNEHADEARFLDMLGDKLGLDPLVRAALSRAANARHRRV